MAEKDQYRQMLHQIRNLLTSNNHTQEQLINISEVDAKKYLAQSYKMIEKDSYKISSDPQLVYSKISEASMLLTKESDMIKNYVKDKIQAEVFSKRRDAEKINQNQYKKLLQAKQKLQKRRFQQKIEESKKISKMIESTRKYKKYENKAEIPLPQLESLLHKERAFVDNVVKQQIAIKSLNNKIETEKGVKIQPFGQKIEKKKSIISKQEQEAFQIQVTAVDQDQSTFLAKKASIYETKLVQRLKHNKNFVKIFSEFLLDQAKKMELASIAPTKSEQNLNSTQQKSKKFTFSNQLIYEGGQQLQQISMRQLSRIYRFKSFFQSKQEEPQKKIKNEKIKKVISKRIGTSNKYHIKQCIIEEDVLYYADEQSNDQTIKIKDMKSIQIGLKPIQQQTQTKQQGNFFQNKQKKIQVVVLKGTNRDFTFELQVGEGAQLKEQICKVNLRRLHKMNCILNQRNNQDMLNFIQEGHPIFNLSENYIRPKQEYPLQQLRQTFLKLLLGLFSQRKSTSILNFTRCELSLDELKLIIKECEKYFSNLSVLNFSHTKLDKETLKVIFNFILKSANSNNLILDLSFCGIDDDALEANLSGLSEVCPKIKQLLFVGNEFTAKTVRNLRNVMASKICEIRQINLSSCYIEEFKQLANLIKIGNKLEVVKANQCRFAINNQSQIEDLLASTSQKQQLKKIQIRRTVCTGTIKWFEQISPYLEIIADIPSKNSGKSLQSKYVRVLLLNSK